MKNSNSGEERVYKSVPWMKFRDKCAATMMCFSTHQRLYCIRPGSSISNKQQNKQKWQRYKANDVVKVSVLFFTSRSDRKILYRVLRSKTFLSRALCLRRRSSGLASGHPLRRLVIHSSAASLSKFRVLTRWYRVGSSSCGLHNIPLDSQSAPAFAAASSCGFSGVHLQPCPNFPWIRTCGCFLARTYDRLRLLPIYLHNLRNYSFVLSGNDALRLDNLGLTDGEFLRALMIVFFFFSPLYSLPAPLFLSTCLSSLLMTPAELNHMCSRTFPLHCVLCTLRTASSRR